ncbi:hypothetical protein IIA79_00530 [bacterium]|nr:hypothetical protein [bacterium]
MRTMLFRILLLTLIAVPCLCSAAQDSASDEATESEEQTPVERLDEIIEIHDLEMGALLELSSRKDFITSGFLATADVIIEMQALADSFVESYGQDSDEARKLVSSIAGPWFVQTLPITKLISLRNMTLDDKRKAARSLAVMESQMRPTLDKLLSGDLLKDALESFNLEEEE